MGKYFKDFDDLCKTFEHLVQRINSMEQVQQDLLDSSLGLKFRYLDFDEDIVLNLKGQRIQLMFGREACAALTPDVEFILQSDTANLFFNGVLNIPIALASRKIVAKGSIPKALKLLPLLKPVYATYRSMLPEIDRKELVIVEKSASPGITTRLSIYLRRIFGQGTKVLPVTQFESPFTSAGSDPVEAISFAEDDLPKDPNKLKLAMLERMMLIRAFEEHLAQAFKEGELPTEMIHLSIGQEACAVGTCFALKTGDWINTTHRGHGHILAKGSEVGKVMAELYGKQSGVCKGRGGSMHVIDLTRGVMGSNGIVGAGPLLANGAALSSLYHKTGQISVVFFGDGATNQGMFHEACNFAAVFKLPVIFVCENNLYGEFTAFTDHCSVDRVIDRAAAYNMPAERVDGNDVMEVYRAMCDAVKRARKGDGPTLLECMTYRIHGHMEGEPTGYRGSEEIAEWKKKDPIRRLEKVLVEQGLADKAAIADMTVRTAEQIRLAVDFALSSADPEPEDLMRHIYSPESPEILQAEFEDDFTGPSTTLSAAVNRAIAEEMERDEGVIMLGEDVRLGGYFAVSQGLVERFGEQRILDTPISEYAIVGASVGAAATGLVPVCEILFSDFLTTCADPILNQAAKLRYMSGGQNRVPMVLRTPVGGYIGGAAQHSQCLEGLFAGLPGLIVCAPSDSYTAYGILKSAIRSQNPVLFFEHKLLYAQASPLPDEVYLLPLGRSRIRRKGSDVTIVGILYGAHLADAAAEQLEAEGISCELIDPVTLHPLDLGTIVDSVARTGRLLVVEEAHQSFGFGARIISAVVECAWKALKAPPASVAAKNVPLPYSKSLELAALPDVEKVLEGIRDLVG